MWCEFKVECARGELDRCACNELSYIIGDQVIVQFVPEHCVRERDGAGPGEARAQSRWSVMRGRGRRGSTMQDLRRGRVRPLPVAKACAGAHCKWGRAARLSSKWPGQVKPRWRPLRLRGEGYHGRN